MLGTASPLVPLSVPPCYHYLLTRIDGYCTSCLLQDEVLLEFHVDDTVDDREDTLIEMAFHVPAANPDWAPADGAAEGEEGAARVSAAKALVDALLHHTDAGASTSDDAVITFHNVASLAPRGRFQVEMHLSYLQLVGQTQDFKIRYTSIGRLFILPKSSTPHTLVVIGLDPPIRKGQTYYSYLLCQFENGDEVTEKLDISDEDLEKKNKECGNKLHRELTGPEYQVFAHALRGLSSAKITRARTEVYQNHAGDGCAVRCSYKADDGFLYPLEKAFFYVHKPPMCINHNDIEYVEFQRQGGTGAAASSVRTFDLLVRQRSVGSDFLFRNIQRSEWEPLFSFINQRKIRIENLAEARQGPRAAAPAIDFGLGEDLDVGVRAARAEADDEEDEDEDFSAAAEDMSESSSGSLDEEGEGSADDAEMVDEEGIDVTAVLGNKGKKRKADGQPGDDGQSAGTAATPKPKKERAPKKPRAPKADKPEAAAAGEGEEGAEPAAEGKKQRKPRKKKDPNAPKKALSAFMFFSNANRERIKTNNPGVAFGQVGKLLGEEWKTLSAEDKAPYEAQAAKDKERYAAAMAEYKAAGGGGQEASGAADEGDAADEEAGEEAE
eukprot:GHUV01024603.1.p1 GENE.GHUV01024603.1~~GHUV01024603.1.p1  ORF type:complete len:609 (+),score=227.34 GHUV01024603.1:931-2757(+)